MIFNGRVQDNSTSFENSDEYRKYIALKHINSPYFMHLETNFGEPVLFVNTDIEENKKLHSDYSDKDIVLLIFEVYIYNHIYLKKYLVTTNVHNKDYQDIERQGTY